MRASYLIAFVALLFAATAAQADLVIDNFSCADGLSQTGLGTTLSVVSCPGSIGGSREDAIFIPAGTGSSSVSTMNSNPPAGAISGTIGGNLNGQELMIWAGSTTPSTVWALPNLDLTGDSVLVQIQSNEVGTLYVNLGSGSVPGGNLLDFTAPLPASVGFTDVLIPLDTPTIIGSGADQSKVTAIGLGIIVPGGTTWTIDGISIVPEPSMTWLLGSVMLIGLVVLHRRRFRSPRVK